MEEKKLQLPAALMRQVCLRIVIGALFLILSCLILWLCHDFFLTLPLLLFSVFFCGSGIHVYWISVKNQYVAVTGTCRAVERSRFRKRTTRIYLLSEPDNITIQVLMKQQTKLREGDHIRIYISDRTPVYDCGGEKLLCAYLAMERI